MIPNPPITVAFSVTGAYLNVFQQGAFAGQIPLLAIPGEPATYIRPNGGRYFRPDGVSTYFRPS